MTWTGAIVIYACSWFVVLWMLLPRGVPTQQEAGHVEPGTPPGAPADLPLSRKLIWITGLAFIPLLVTTAIMESEILTLDDFSFLFPASFMEAPVSRQ